MNDLEKQKLIEKYNNFSAYEWMQEIIQDFENKLYSDLVFLEMLIKALASGGEFSATAPGNLENIDFLMIIELLEPRSLKLCLNAIKEHYFIFENKQGYEEGEQDILCKVAYHILLSQDIVEQSFIVKELVETTDFFGLNLNHPFDTFVISQGAVDATLQTLQGKSKMVDIRIRLKNVHKDDLERIFPSEP